MSPFCLSLRDSFDWCWTNGLLLLTRTLKSRWPGWLLDRVSTKRLARWSHTCPLVHVMTWHVCAPITEKKTLDFCKQTFDLHSQQPSGLLGTWCFSEAQWSSKCLGFRISRPELVNGLCHLAAVWSWASHFTFSAAFISSVCDGMRHCGLWLQAKEAKLGCCKEAHDQRTRVRCRAAQG